MQRQNTRVVIILLSLVLLTMLYYIMSGISPATNTRISQHNYRFIPSSYLLSKDSGEPNAYNKRERSDYGINVHRSDQSKTEKENRDTNVQKMEEQGEDGISVHRYDEGRWTVDKTICAALNTKESYRNFTKVVFRSQVGNMPIYIHDTKNDYISLTIKNSKNFEPSIFRMIHTILSTDSKMNFVDIGANIGVYTLQVAKFGRQVIAVEALPENAQHLCASMKAGNVHQNITVINNALSYDHTPVKMARAEKGDSGFGAAFVDRNDGAHSQKLSANGDVFSKSYFLKTVMLDDVLDLLSTEQFKNIFIKMDVEGWEHQVLQGAKKFFNAIQVEGVLMEFRWHIQQPSRNIITNFFKEFNFSPFQCIKRHLTKLNPLTMKNHDVLWLPMRNENRYKICV